MKLALVLVVTVVGSLSACALGTPTSERAGIARSAQPLGARINAPIFSESHFRAMGGVVNAIHRRLTGDHQGLRVDVAFEAVHDVATFRTSFRNMLANLGQTPAGEQYQGAEILRSLPKVVETLRSNAMALQDRGAGPQLALAQQELIWLSGQEVGLLNSLRRLTSHAGREQLDALGRRLDAFLDDAISAAIRIERLKVEAEHRELPHREGGYVSTIAQLEHGAWRQQMAAARDAVEGSRDPAQAYRQAIDGLVQSGVLSGEYDAPVLNIADTTEGSAIRALDELEEMLWRDVGRLANPDLN